jgi:hypothetical protein
VGACLLADLPSKNTLTSGIWVVGNTSGLLDLGKNGIVKRTVLCCYIFLIDKVVYEIFSHVVLVVYVNWGFESMQYEKRVDCFCIS